MKKILSIALAVLMAFIMVSCPEKEDNKDPTGPFTVGFDKNHTDAGGKEANPPTMMVTPPATTVASLPANPERPGYIFVKWTVDKAGNGAEFTVDTVVKKDVTVYAQWKQGFTVTFDKNGGEVEANPAIKTVTPPATTIDALPTIPEREGFTFKEWNTNDLGGTNTVFTATTPVTASVTVYAIWEFVGGTPKLVDGKIVHNMPVMEFTGDTVQWHEDGDGTITFGAGNALDYLFPTNVSGQSALDFDYFVVQTAILSDEASSSSANIGATIRQYKAGTAYTGGGTNKMPWLDTTDGQKMVLDVKGAGTTNGFRIAHTGSLEAKKFRINSITFYKAPRYTVTFTSAHSEGKVVNNVWGKDDNHTGPGVGNTDWPVLTAGDTVVAGATTYYFLGWFDGDDEYIAATAITKNTTLTAKWTDIQPPMVQYVRLNHNNTAAFKFAVGATGKTWGDIKKITYKVKVTDAAAYATFSGMSNLRNHIVYVGNVGDPGVNGQYSAQWGGNRLISLAPNGGASYSTVFGGDKFNEWVTFTADFVENFNGNGGNEYWGTWNTPANLSNNTDIVFGVGIGVNRNNTTEYFGYFIKDISLVMDDGSLVTAVVDETNVHHHWAAGGQPVVDSSFKPCID